LFGSGLVGRNEKDPLQSWYNKAIQDHRQEKHQEAPMIQAVFFKDGVRRKDLSLEGIGQALQDPAGLLWVSLEQTTAEEAHTVLHDIFHFHPLAVEDCLNLGYQPPKVDDFGDHLFIIMHALIPKLPLDQLNTMELNVFLGSNYVVTSYLDPEMPPVRAVRQRLERDERLCLHGADFLCHAVLDALVDEYMPVIDKMDDIIDELEDEVLIHPEPRTLERILDLKHSVLTLRRIIAPQREVVNRLSRGDMTLIAERNRIYFRDIYDHLVRVHDLSESVRDIITSTLETYLSVTSNRMNEVMKALTIVSTIFLPLTFITGLYGMNFVYMPELRWRYSYLVVWGLFVLVTLGMLWFFRRKRWI
jgi:magnesium transporter